MSNRFGWGLVGPGMRARDVMIPTLNELPRAKLVGACGSSPERTAEALAGWPELKVFAKLDDLLADPKVQVVYIASPHFLHVPQAVSVIESGKHIFMESPLALSVDGAHKLIEKARLKGVKLGLAFQFRFHSAVRDLRDKIMAGDLGEINHIKVSYSENFTWPANWWSDTIRSGPAAVLRYTVHALDLAAWLHPGAVAEVMAMGDDDPATGINNQASVLLRYASGGLGVTAGSALAGRQNHCVRVEGSRGSVTLEGNLGGTEPIAMREFHEGRTSVKEYKPENPVARMLKDFNKSLTDGTEFSPEGKDGKKIVEITCAVIESLKNKRAVKVGEVLRLT